MIDDSLTFDEISGGRLAATAHMRSLLAVNRLGYTWENYGVLWETDHNLPLSNISFLSTLPFILLINHYTNLVPMEHSLNMKKGSTNKWDKIPKLIPQDSPSY